MNYPLTVIDFETYYDTEYSLKRLTTEEYVRNELFKVHCVAVACSDGTRKVFTGDFHNNLKPYMDGFVICQKAQFDGFILSQWFDLYPKYWGCTLSMARAQLQHLKSHSLESLCKYFNLPEKSIDYNAFKGKRDLDPDTFNMLCNGCLNDAEQTLRIAEILLADFPPAQLQIIDKTIRMFTQPVLCLDIPRITNELERIKKEKAEALEKTGVTKEDLMSSKKFSAILQEQGIEVLMKTSPKGKEIPALAKTDEFMKSLVEHENGTIAALAAARLGEKSTLLETRCERLISIFSRGVLPVFLNYCGAHTGRWSGGDKMNWQNFTSGSELRKSILAALGYKLVGVDSAQIECRLVNWLAGQLDIVEAFREGRDIYCELGTKLFGKIITKQDKEERQFSKEVELASGFGMGWLKFQRRVLQKYNKRITDAEAENAISVYRSTHPKVTALWRAFQKIIENMGKGLPPYQFKCLIIDGYKIIMPDGTFLDYTGMYYDGEDYRLGKSKIYGGLVTENVIQKLGWVIICNAIRNIDDAYNYKLVTTTHDDLLYAIPEQDNTALDNILKIMKQSPDWCKDLPLGAEGFESARYDK